MIWLKKLFGKDDKFFDLLEAGSEEAKASVELFSQYLKTVAAGASPNSTLDQFIQTRRKEKRIRHTMTEELCKTFVTPLEREDIEALSFALYRIPKQVEKIVERLSIYPGRVPHTAFERQAELMLLAAEAGLRRAGLVLELVTPCGPQAAAEKPLQRLLDWRPLLRAGGAAPPSPMLERCLVLADAERGLDGQGLLKGLDALHGQ